MDLMNHEHGRLTRTLGAVRPVWLIGLILLLSSAFSHAETLYVSGYREIMLRTGPSVGHRIIAVLKTGNQVEAVGTEGDYHLVSLPDGRQGYVLNSFLTNEAPPRRQIEDLTAKVEAQAAELDQLRGEHLQVMAENDKLNKDNQSDRRQLRRLQQESTDLQRDMRLAWFVAGAGVLLIGWLLGWTRVRLRRRARARSFT
jgi:SH3 domain protein